MATPVEQVEIQRVRDAVLARVHGEVDLSNAAAVKDRIVGAVPNGAAGLVLDLSGTDYLDSSGVRLLFELAERLRRRGQRLDLVVPADSVIRGVLTLTEVDQAAAIFATVEEALPGS